MSFKYAVLKKLVAAAGLKKRWLSATTEELLENRRKQNAKNRIPALKDDAFEFSRIDVMGFQWHNAWALLTVPVNWMILTVTLKRTEEKWLLDLYGQDYADYMKRVNRCIPWPPRKA